MIFMRQRNSQFIFPFEIIQKKPSGFFRYIFLLMWLLCIGTIISFVLWVRAPKDFTPDSIITVYSGMSSKDLSQVLETGNIIQSGQLFRFFLSTKLNQKPIIAGDYIFEKPQNIFTILHRINHGTYGNGRIKVTFPEGITIKQMSEILSEKIPGFNTAEFLISAQKKEGFLFPNTYYFFRTSNAEQVVNAMLLESDKVKKQFVDFFDENWITKDLIYGKKRTWNEIVIMASILEREAKNSDEAKVIAGILWKRMQQEMPLQVDATFLYTLQKRSKDLTLNDLRSDGPYNTYTRQGLPVGPIGNPGKLMIESALQPQDSPYLFYLHGTNGKIYYGKTHDDHVKNKSLYLK